MEKLVHPAVLIGCIWNDLNFISLKYGYLSNNGVDFTNRYAFYLNTLI